MVFAPLRGAAAIAQREAREPAIRRSAGGRAEPLVHDPAEHAGHEPAAVPGAVPRHFLGDPFGHAAEQRVDFRLVVSVFGDAIEDVLAQRLISGKVFAQNLAKLGQRKPLFPVHQLVDGVERVHQIR